MTRAEFINRVCRYGEEYTSDNYRKRAQVFNELLDYFDQTAKRIVELEGQHESANVRIAELEAENASLRDASTALDAIPDKYFRQVFVETGCAENA